MDGHFPSSLPLTVRVMQTTQLTLIALDSHVQHAQIKTLSELVQIFHWLHITQILTTNMLVAILHADFWHTIIGEINLLVEILHQELQLISIVAPVPMTLLILAGKDQIQIWPTLKLSMPIVIPTHGHMTTLSGLRRAVPKTLLLL